MPRSDENTIVRLAAQQRRVVTVEQLHAAGRDNAAIERRCRSGLMHACIGAHQLLRPADPADVLNRNRGWRSKCAMGWMRWRASRIASTPGALAVSVRWVA
jgi:hypothetical protein